MEDNNHKIEMALEKTLKTIKHIGNAHNIEAGLIRLMFIRFADGLKDSEPAGPDPDIGKCPECGGAVTKLYHRVHCKNCGIQNNTPVVQPLVRPPVLNPKGRVWHINNRESTIGEHLDNHLETVWCPIVGCRPMTFAEAFVPGARVRWEDGEHDMIVEGRILGHLNSSKEMARIHGLPLKWWIHISDLTLVTPAPPKEECKACEMKICTNPEHEGYAT